MTDEQRKELEARVVEHIKTVFDPEIPVNVYDLGLIYEVKVADNSDVFILMTLTAPNCPEAEDMPVKIEQRVREIHEVNDVKVMITFDPPWSRDKMTEDAQLILGMSM
jgi:FeS assembly SUF system protein